MFKVRITLNITFLIYIIYEFMHHFSCIKIEIRIEKLVFLVQVHEVTSKFRIILTIHIHTPFAYIFRIILGSF